MGDVSAHELGLPLFTLVVGVTLNRSRLRPRAGQVLQIISTAMLVLGLLLIFRPGWLAFTS